MCPAKSGNVATISGDNVASIIGPLEITWSCAEAHKTIAEEVSAIGKLEVAVSKSNGPICIDRHPKCDRHNWYRRWHFCVTASG